MNGRSAHIVAAIAPKIMEYSRTFRLPVSVKRVDITIAPGTKADIVMTRHEMYFPEVPLQRGQNATPVEECCHLLSAVMEPSRSRKLVKASRIPLTPTKRKSANRAEVEE